MNLTDEQMAAVEAYRAAAQAHNSAVQENTLAYQAVEQAETVAKAAYIKAREARKLMYEAHDRMRIALLGANAVNIDNAP